MNQILGINLHNSHIEESLTGCDPLETLSDDILLAIGFEKNELGMETQIDWLSDALQPKSTILAQSSIDPEELLASGQEADYSTEIDRFITDLPPESEASQTNLEPPLFEL